MKIFIPCKKCLRATEHTHIVRQIYICTVCGTQNSGHGKRVEKPAGKRGRKPALTSEDRQEAYRLHVIGLTDKAIANRLQVCIATARKAWKEMEAAHG